MSFEYVQGLFGNGDVTEGVVRRRLKGKRKGQALVLEEVLMFALGIGIVTGLVFVFSNIDDSIQNFVNKDQSEEINSLVRACIITLDTSGCTKCNMMFEIPENIGGEKYTIYGEGNKRKVLIYDNQDVWNEKAVPVDVYGTVTESSKILIEYDGGIVYLKGVDDY